MKFKTWLLASMLALSSFSVFPVLATENDNINIYFARHGKTILNTYDKVQGWSDSPLTSDGVETARYLGAGLKGIPFDSYYTSDAGRQRETMQVILQETGKPAVKVTELPGLREMFFGGFEGTPNPYMWNFAAKRAGVTSTDVLFKQIAEGKVDLVTMVNVISQSDDKKEAESALQVKTRMKGAMDTMVQNALKNGDKNILSVSSGLSMLMMLSDMTDSPNKNKPLQNAAVVKITYRDGKYTVVDIGDMSYVAKGKEIINKK